MTEMTSIDPEITSEPILEPSSVDSPALPPLTREHVDQCAFQSWFPRFRSVTFASRVIGPLPPEFVEYLHADGVYLPLDSNGDPQPRNGTDDSGSDSDSDGTKSEATQEDDWLANIPAFPDLDGQIATAIEELGGAVFPKLNWTAPRDASWVALNNSLKCTSPADVFLLLKSSDFIAHDLGNPYHMTRGEEDPVPAGQEQQPPPDHYYLALRKWIEVEPSMEFRCFVRRRQLVGISQRDTFNFYPFLKSMKDEISKNILKFWSEVVESRFSDENFTFDVYLSNRTETLRPLIVDFNPFAYYTDALLFDWDELAVWDKPLEFRLVESDEHARGCSRGWANPKYASSRLPLEASVVPGPEAWSGQSGAEGE